MRLALIVMMVLSSLRGHAVVTSDRIEAALTTLRGRVVFHDQVSNAPLVRRGANVLALAVFASGIFWIGRYPRFGPLQPIERWIVGVPVLVGAGGASAIVAGLARRRKPVAPTRATRAAAEYRTVSGFEEFMTLAPREQSIVAHADPEFAEFIVSLAEAYQFLKDHPVDRVGRPPVRRAAR